MRAKHGNATKKSASAAGLLSLIILFELAAFATLALKDGAIDINAIIVGLMMVGLLLFQYYALNAFFKHIDKYLLIIANVLIAIGMVMQYRLSADNAFKQLIMIGVGMVLMVVAIVLLRWPEFFKRMKWPIMLASIPFLMLPMVFGRTIGGARNWVALGESFSFQPSEFIKIAWVIVLASWLSEKTRVKEFWPMGVFAAAAVCILMYERDLGAVMLYFGTAVIVYYVATGKKLNTALIIGAGAGGAVASYFVFSHVRVRIAVWKNPWSTYYSSGYQVAQGLMAIGSGGLWGSGLGLGSPGSIPAYSTDYIFAVICEEFGIIVGLCVIAFYLVFILRGAKIALNAPNRFLMLLAFGCTTLITLQSFIIIGGVIKLIPLTGITLPFLSYGGSSVASAFLQLGIIEGVAIKNGENDEAEIAEMGGGFV